MAFPFRPTSYIYLREVFILYVTLDVTFLVKKKKKVGFGLYGLFSCSAVQGGEFSQSLNSIKALSYTNL